MQGLAVGVTGAEISLDTTTGTLGELCEWKHYFSNLLCTVLCICLQMLNLKKTNLHGFLQWHCGKDAIAIPV